MAEEKKITDTQKDETIKDDVYQVKSGTFKVMSQNAKNYHKDMEAGLAHKPSDRPKYLEQLSPEERKFVQAANEQGKGVRWTNENGDHVFTFVPSKEQKEKAALRKRQKKRPRKERKKRDLHGGNGCWVVWLLSDSESEPISCFARKINLIRKVQQTIQQIRLQIRIRTQRQIRRRIRTLTLIRIRQPISLRRPLTRAVV